MSGSKTPTLLIVMGTSGSGKSTVGSALSSALHCPFVDGDDLHPASNVAKMSRGQPLDDADREPWLHTIRTTGLRLATTQLQPRLDAGESSTRALAEVYETSHAQTTPLDHAAAAAQEADASQGAIKEGDTRLAVIACSALKLVYRRLLRGTLPSLNDPAAVEPESAGSQPQDLRVVHIYLDLSKPLLEERMTNRKGHFMKLDMLYSQLDTLQVPDPQTEPDVVVVKVERGMSTEEVVRDAVGQLRALGVV